MDWGLGNSNKTAARIAILMVAVLGLAYLRRWGFWAALVRFFGLGMCPVHTFSRGGLVALLAGMIPLVATVPRPWRGKHITGVVLAVWGIAGASIYLQAHKRCELGVICEDRSITNRFELWKAAPTMTVDDPGGWGVCNSGKAFADRYQLLDKTERYRTLLNSHPSPIAETEHSLLS